MNDYRPGDQVFVKALNPLQHEWWWVRATVAEGHAIELEHDLIVVRREGSDKLLFFDPVNVKPVDAVTRLAELAKNVSADAGRTEA
jgi:hypothetical protein